MKSDFCVSPHEPIAQPPAGNRGAKGEYNGESGFPQRTSSPNGVPELAIEDHDAKAPTGDITGATGSEGNKK